MWSKVKPSFVYVLSIVCPVYNNHKFTRHIFKQIEALNPELHNYEVIFYDDGSTDGTQDMRPDFKHTWIQGQNNYWVTHAWNTLIDQTKGRFVLVINNDIVITPEVIEEMMDTMNQNTDCMVVNAKQIMPGNIIINGKLTDTDNISGPAWMIRKKDRDLIGPIPSQLIMFGNDDYVYLKVTQWLKKKSIWTDYPIFHFTSQTVKDYWKLSEVTINDIKELRKIVEKNKWSHPKLYDMIKDRKIK